MITRKTKIVCSIGPASDDDSIVRKMILGGMDVARFNFSHGDHEWHKAAMERVRRISAELKIPVAILLDTKGPEIRTGVTEGNCTMQIHAGDRIEVVADGSACYGASGGNPGHVSLSWTGLPERVKPGTRILIADGLIELDAERIQNGKVICSARNSGDIGSRKNVNLVGIHAGLPIMSAQDRSDIAFGVGEHIDFVAASFVSYPEEVAQIREYLTSLGSHALIIAKIENQEGLDNIDRIIEEADGIMVARGDLGVQIATERIPLIQKSLIAKCREAGKTVITATQMLDSMIVNPRPTRAELTDVANAVFDGTDAVMLSGETASGKYPVDSVETMARIAQTTENSEEYRCRMLEIDRTYAVEADIGHLVARNAFTLAADIKAKAIITPTLHGNTARMISRFRPVQTVIAVTPYEQIERQLMLSWGVVPMLAKLVSDSEDMIQNSIKMALDEKAVTFSDRIVMVAGIPLHSPLMANTIKVLLVGNVLARGTGYGHADPALSQASGRIVCAETPAAARAFLKNNRSPLLVCRRITDEYIPILRLVDGVIAESGSDLDSGRLSQVNRRLVWITDAPDVMRTLESGLSVTVDGEQGLVYEGII